MPTRTSWQKAIDDLSFDNVLTLDTDFQPIEYDGLLRCEWGSSYEAVVIEHHNHAATDISTKHAALQGIVDDYDLCISLSWGNRVRDFAAAGMACCALIKNFDAVVSYNGEKPDAFESFLLKTTEDYLTLKSEKPCRS